MEDLIGTVIGRWTLLAEDKEKTIKSKHLYYLCKCLCGVVKVVRYSSMRAGDSLSCGCLRDEQAGDRARTHGCSKHPCWQAYYDMYRRCYDPSRKDYHHYGGKGIKVCNEWLSGWESGNGFKQFLEDMGEKPLGKSEIERVDRFGDYSKSNCYWENRKAQTNNTSQNRMIEFEGFTLTLSEWSHLISIRPQIICDRLNKLQWGVEKALTTPPRMRGKNAKGVNGYRGADFALEFLRTKEGLDDAFSLSILRKLYHE